MRVLCGNAIARGGAAARSFASPASSYYGRTAAYRRLYSLELASRSRQAHHDHTIRNLIPLTRPPFVLKSSFLPSELSPFASTASARRWISFKDLKSDSASAQGARKGESKEDATSEQPAKAESVRPPEEDATTKAKAEEGTSSSGMTYDEWRRQQRGEGKSETVEEPESEQPKAEPEGEAESAGEKREGKEGKEGKEGEKEKPPPPPPHGDKTPWQVFTETLGSEFKKSKEWNESTKALASSAHDFTQNENVKRLTAAYNKGTDTATSATSAAVKSTGRVIGQSAAWTWDTPVVKGLRKGAGAVGSGIEKATRPVRETTAYKDVKKVLDDGSSSRYGGWVEKEERRKRREMKEQEAVAKGKQRPIEKFEEDPNAGTNVTVHKDSAWKESWRDFRDNSRVMQSLFSMNRTYKESDNPFISTARGISDRVAGFFAENETAMVVKKFREMDPNFKLEPFLTEMRDWMLPEVLDAYVKGDVETLKLWLSTPQYQVYDALMRQYTTAGLKSDGRILDIRHVDILSARLLDPGEVPVFIITCRTQEVHVYRNAKSNELAAGMEDKVQQVTYAIGVTRIPEDVSNPETRGWRLIELQKSAREYI